MASYQTKDIRNIALMGHGSEGKTTLMEALLFAAGAIDRQGRVEDGNTVTDYDAEEIKRKISISAAIAPIDWNQKMLNVIDVPGYFDFVGEMMGPLRVVETAAILGQRRQRHRCRHRKGLGLCHQEQRGQNVHRQPDGP